MNGLALTDKERAVLDVLRAGAGAPVSRAAIMAALYGDDDDAPFDKIVVVYVCRLRKKLEAHGATILNIFGQGYVIDDPKRALAPLLGPPPSANADSAAERGLPEPAVAPALAATAGEGRSC